MNELIRCGEEEEEEGFLFVRVCGFCSGDWIVLKVLFSSRLFCLGFIYSLVL